MATDRRQSGLWSRNPETGIFEQTSAAPKAQITGNFYTQPHVSPTASASSGPYSYYHPPATDTRHRKRSFSARQAQSTDPDADVNANANPNANPNPNAPVPSKSRRQRSNTLDADVVQHASQQDLPRPLPSPPSKPSHHAMSGQPPPLRVDPNYASNNARSQPWSPDPLSPSSVNASNPLPKTRRSSNPSNAAEAVRKSSVPDRSPLQSLESWSKEEKRARVERAEQKARQKSDTVTRERRGTVKSEKARVVSESAAVGQSSPIAPQRNVSEGRNDEAARRFRDARDAELQADAMPSSRTSRPIPAANETRVYERQTRQPPMTQLPTSEDAPRGSLDIGSSPSRKYRAKNAGFAGAEAAAFSAPTYSGQGQDPVAVERGKAAYRRRSQMHSDVQPSPISPLSPPESDQSGVGRSGSKKLQKRSPLVEQYETGQQWQTDRMGGFPGSKKEHDPTPRASVENSRPDAGVRYVMPPQTTNAQHAREQLGFAPSAQGKHHRGVRGFFHQDHERRGYVSSNQSLDEWRQAKPVVLTSEDIEFEQADDAGAANDDPWWEKRNKRRTSSSGSRRVPDIAQYDGPYEEKATGFQPRLFLKCGPLLRYTGIRKQPPIRDPRTNNITQREIWKGSVMIVTEDEQSDLSSPPRLRLFAQPMDLHKPPPKHLLQSGHELPPECEDPVAGQVKMSRTGRTLYVRPVHDIDGGIDLSREENNQGLFSAQRTPVLGPQSTIGADGRSTKHIAFQDKSRIKKRDGERTGRYREVRAIRLHSERGYTFWRFSLEVELTAKQARVAYRINSGPAIGFWVPARGEAMNIMFHSCNGFSLSVDTHTFSGPDPLWRDVLNRHQSRPFHVMLGGGDQIYNDAAMRDTVLFREWLQMKNPQHKHAAQFTEDMQEELEEFYLNRYAMWFSQGLFSMTASQIPMVNIWDDHDIIDGYGSYPHHFMSTRVFTGLGAIAYKYYMLFQHQSIPAETEREEPSWLLGPSPGPYINFPSRSLFMSLGRHLALLALDCRTERMRDEILSQETYDVIFDRCRAEIARGETKHLLVLLGVPIAYPRLNFLENILTSRVMDPVKAIGRTGALGGFVNKFDGGVEILDDLDDHWTAKHHKAERNWFIQELQELAAEKSVRITILGGDVHLGAVGQFYTNPKINNPHGDTGTVMMVPKDRDHRYMPNVISSAIVNTPPPNVMADVLNKRNKVHHLDAETDENMIPMFSHDVDGKRRNNNHLLPRRNFCIIREYVPGSTPPSSPRVEEREYSFDGGDDERERMKDRRFPPGSMKRTMSLTRGPMNLVRRLSGSRKTGTPVSLGSEHTRPYGESEPRASVGIQRSNSTSTAEGRRARMNQFPTPAVDTTKTGDDSDLPPDFERRPSFRRRPTLLTEQQKAAAKKKRTFSFSAGGGQIDGADGNDAAGAHVSAPEIDLEGGLDISLCMEIDQLNPAGTTVPYRLLVPALWYDDQHGGDPNTVRFPVKRKENLMQRLGIGRKRAPEEARVYAQEQYSEVEGGTDSYHEADRGVYSEPESSSRHASGSARHFFRSDLASDGSRTPTTTTATTPGPLRDAFDHSTEHNTLLNSNPNFGRPLPFLGKKTAAAPLSSAPSTSSPEQILDSTRTRRRAPLPTAYDYPGGTYPTAPPVPAFRRDPAPPTTDPAPSRVRSLSAGAGAARKYPYYPTSGYRRAKGVGRDVRIPAGAGRSPYGVSGGEARRGGYGSRGDDYGGYDDDLDDDGDDGDDDEDDDLSETTGSETEVGRGLRRRATTTGVGLGMGMARKMERVLGRGRGMGSGREGERDEGGGERKRAVGSGPGWKIWK